MSIIFTLQLNVELYKKIEIRKFRFWISFFCKAWPSVLCQFSSPNCTRPFVSSQKDEMALPQEDSVLKAARDQTSTPSDIIGAEAKPPSKTAKIYKKPKQKPPMEPPVPTIAIFYGFLLVNTLAAAFAPIQDCDEVFNYWEPTHYLNHGSGLQTWEYSPEFSIRSWLYIVIHAIIGKFGSLLSTRSTAEFYAVRMALGAICALCETRLFSTICKTFNPRVGILFGIVMVFSPGMFHASVAYLPSSFSMYTTMLGMAAFMDWRGGLKTGLGMMWFGIGALVGWPFSGALIIPLLAEDAVLSSMTGDVSEIVFRYLDGVVRSLIVLVSGALNEEMRLLIQFRLCKLLWMLFSTTW